MIICILYEIFAISYSWSMIFVSFLLLLLLLNAQIASVILQFWQIRQYAAEKRIGNNRRFENVKILKVDVFHL